MTAGSDGVLTAAGGSADRVATRPTGSLGTLAVLRAPRYFAAGIALVSALFAAPAWAVGHEGAPRRETSATSGSHVLRFEPSARVRSQTRTRPRTRSSAGGRALAPFTPAPPEPGYDGRPIETLMTLSDSTKPHMTPAERRYLIRAVGVQRAALSTDHVRRLESLGGWTAEVALESLPDHIRDQGSTGTCYAQAHFNMLQNGWARRNPGQHVKLQIASHNHPSLMVRFDALLRDAGSSDEALPVTALGEGGYFHWSDAIAERFGVVPEADVDGRPIWPNNENTTDTATLIGTLRQYVVDADVAIRALPPTLNQKERAKEAARIRREARALGRQLLDDALGVPPKSFVYNGRRYTPRQFFREMGVRGSDFVTLVNPTTAGSSYNTRTRIPAWLGNPEGWAYQTSIENMMAAAKATIDAGDGVWISTKFGSENLYITPTAADARYPTAALGLASFDAYKYGALGLPEPDSRREYEGSGERLGNHALLMTAYTADPARPDRAFEIARIDNSWNTYVGQTSSGNEGHWLWDRSFFTRGGVDMLVVRKSALTGRLAERVAHFEGRDAAVSKAMKEVEKQFG